MTSRASSRQSQRGSYKQIHLKQLTSNFQRITSNQDQKNNQYFPNRQNKRPSNNYYLDSSRTNTSNKDISESSRYNNKQSTASTSALQENRMLAKENQKLKKDISKYERQLLEKQEKTIGVKKIETQLVETYRVIHYYEGKMQELERICKVYEKELNIVDSKKSKNGKINQSKINFIVESFRHQNVQLSAQVQQNNRQIVKLSNSLRNYQAKYFALQQKNQQLNKKFSLQTNKPKFIDDYERVNLQVKPPTSRQQFIKKRPNLSIKKGAKDTGQSESQNSVYKNSIYVNRKKSQLSKGRDDCVNNSRQKSIALGNLNSRMNMLQNQIEKLRKQNQKLNDELDTKLEENIKLKAQNQEMQFKMSIMKDIQNNDKEKQKQTIKTVTITKDKLREIQQPSTVNKIQAGKPEDNKLSFFVSNVSNMSNMSNSKSNVSLSCNKLEGGSLQSKIQEKQKLSKKAAYKFTQIKERTIRKLILNIVREDVTYINLVDSLAHAWNSDDSNSLIEVLEDVPYQLSSSQTSQFMFQYKLIMKYISSRERESANKDMTQQQYKKCVQDELKHIIRDNIPFFKNITIRRDFTLNIQLSNKFKNYEDQYEQLVRKYNDKMPYKDCQHQFVEKWGLTNEEFLFLLIKNYEQNEEIDYVHISTIGKYFLLD